MNISSSGIRAGQALFDVAAHNLANVSSDPFRPLRVELSEAPGPPGRPGRGVEVTAIADSDSGGVDVAAELVATMTASALYRLNVKVLAAEAEMTRSLLDVRA